MPDLGFAIAVAAVKCIARVWVNDNSIDGPVDDIRAIFSRIEPAGPGQRRVALQLENVAESLSERLTPLIQAEAAGLDDGDRSVAVESVELALRAIPVATARDLVERNMNATYLAETMRDTIRSAAAAQGLSEAGLALQERLVVESALYVLEIATRLPSYAAIRDELILTRSSRLEELVEEALSRLPRFEPDGSRPAEDEQFEHLYRIALKHKTDQVRLFGLQGQTSNAHYPLSVAYISLSIETVRDPRVVSATGARLEDVPSTSGDMSGDVKLEELLGETSKLILVGGAGSGKTTLLNWIALSSVSPNVATRVPKGWKERVPFIVPLRQFAEKELPSIEQLSVTTIQSLTAPVGWAQRVFTQGRATLLIDGLDEVSKRRRGDVYSWLDSILSIFPETNIVVSTRPTGLPKQWSDDLKFTRADIQEMRPVDTRVFIQKWHTAAAHAGTSPGFGTVEDAERAMQEIARTRPAIKALSNTPLLCALICALHFKHGSSLPKNRIELYDTALVMLLAARDNERKVDISHIELSQTQRRTIIRDFALWMHENGLSDASTDDYTSSVALSMKRISGTSVPPSEIAGFLMERSGILREPVPNRVDFVHRTFLEYLAAVAIVEDNSIEKLVLHAENDQWREVIILAAGVAQKHQREKLLSRLLAIGRDSPATRHRHYLLAIACLETAPELPVELRRDLEMAVSEVVPPHTMGEALAIASAGQLAVPLLGSSPTLKARPAAASVRALCMIGTEEALERLSSYREERRVTVTRELLRGWPNFDPARYAATVLGGVDLAREPAIVADPSLVPHLASLRADSRIFLDLPRRYEHVREIPRLPSSVYGADLSGLQGVQSVNDIPISDAGSLVLDSSSIESLHGIEDHPALFYFSALGCDRLRTGGDLRNTSGLRSFLVGGAPLDKLEFLAEAASPIGNVSLISLPELRAISAPIKTHALRISECDSLISLVGVADSIDLDILHIDRLKARSLRLPANLRTLQVIVAEGEIDMSGGEELQAAILPENAIEGISEWIAARPKLERLTLLSHRPKKLSDETRTALSRLGQEGTGPELITLSGLIETTDDLTIDGYARVVPPQRAPRFSAVAFRRLDQAA
ncbi:hypothetical protein AUC47_03230 [Microbacterium sp. SZ1]|uniref:NACHT domain-containing protein n=1 Tax=Microbacterium sp. SZ1 TaxID=1849736 RepID=UPI000BD743C6|nr:NACHT domain-containing protein [Microbacterium sp. SZ1]PCE14606.1 hypothetical protein AUC47_03230 [Microbacterium sp. SZ1]